MSGIIHVGGFDGREYASETRPLLIFEPLPESFQALEENLAHRDNVETVCAACGSKPGTMTLWLSEPTHSSSLLRPAVDSFSTREISDIRFTDTAKVTVTTLDEHLQGRGGFDDLRIDTQGYELEVLKGAVQTLAGIRRIELELHDPGIYPGAASLDDLDGWLARHDFWRTDLDTLGSDGLGDATYERSA